MNIHDRIADAFASIDELVSDAATKFKGRLLTLLNKQGERNEGIWNDAGARLDLTMDMLVRVPLAQRSSTNEWMSSFERMLAAAMEQTWIELEALPMFAKATKHLQRVKSAWSEMSQTELRQAAAEGTSTETFNRAKQARMARTTVL